MGDLARVRQGLNGATTKNLPFGYDSLGLLICGGVVYQFFGLLLNPMMANRRSAAHAESRRFSTFSFW